MAGHQWTADTPAGGGRADTPADGGQAGAILRMGIHSCAMGEGRIRREPQRGGREDASTRRCYFFGACCMTFFFSEKICFALRKISGYRAVSHFFVSYLFCVCMLKSY
jgi:hypothetical protein